MRRRLEAELHRLLKAQRLTGEDLRGILCFVKCQPFHYSVEEARQELGYWGMPTDFAIHGHLFIGGCIAAYCKSRHSGLYYDTGFGMAFTLFFTLLPKTLQVALANDCLDGSASPFFVFSSLSMVWQDFLNYQNSGVRGRHYVRLWG